jgi:hypothetical protein
MLDTLPYADLLAIHNALSEKPTRRFDTRANGEKRTLALMEGQGLTLEEAAHLASVVLSASDAADIEPPAEEPAEPSLQASVAQADAAAPEGQDGDATIIVAALLAPVVTAFVTELTKPEQPAFLVTFLRRLTGDSIRRATPRERQMTGSQTKIVELCSRPEGATGRELAEGCGWPSIAARATCQKLADRYGYDLQESPKANGRGISFRMTAKQATEQQA